MSDELTTFKLFAQNFTVAGQPFFRATGAISTARAPGRLDVMGGIADYSGSLVLEMPIAEATYAAVQRTDELILTIVTLRGVDEEEASTFSMPLADFGALDRPVEYKTATTYFQKTPGSSWAAYIAGVFLVLMREKKIEFSRGARILLRSTVPEGKGVSSSAAVEVATMLAVSKAFGIPLEPVELATLCQIVENRVAGAPCGIMDQMTVVNGRQNQLLALLCQPATIQGYIDIPDQFKFWGIDSGIRHAVSGSDYGAVRVGAFMGHKIIETRSDEHLAGYLANITPSLFEQHYRQILPETIVGAEFLARFSELPDDITTVDPKRVYAVQQPTAHPIYENFRVKAFAQLLNRRKMDNGQLLGELMYQSHASYSACGLGSSGTDLLVALVRKMGPANGLYGAKITGGGSGGTVAVLGSHDAEAAIHDIASQYQKETGHQPYIFTGSSTGAY